MERLNKLHRAMEAPSCDHTDKIDRISQLPDEVLYNILSFLDVFNAVRAGLVSKRWERLCSALPFLDIDIIKLLYQRNLVLSSEMCQQFEHFVSWVLTSRSANNIARLRLRCGGIFSQEQVFRWMCAATRRNVQELILMFHPSEVFHMPFSLVNGQSLKSLELSLFGQVLQLPNYPGLLHLKSLCLEHIKFTDEELTRSLFSGCPLLKKLVLNFCTFENIKVLHISFTSLEHLLLEDGHDDDRGYDKFDLKISCPKLLDFKYGAPAPRQFIFEGVVSLEIMHIHPWVCNSEIPYKAVASGVYGVLKVVHKMVVLKLGLCIIFGLCEMFDEFKSAICSFHGLKALNLCLTLWETYMSFLILLLEHSPNLETLTLYLDEENSKTEFGDFSKITCLRSTVSTLNLINFKGEDMMRWSW